MSRFIDPKNDLAFKKIFGSEQSSELLADFLNGVMGLTEANRIEVATIIDPYQIPSKVLTDKLSIVDVKCKDLQGKTYIVEMQLLSKDAFLSRVAYNVGKSYANQLKIAVPYSTLKDVIGVTIVNFELFPEFPDRYISRHEIIEVVSQISFMKQFRFYFVELPKFKKSLDEVESDIDKWLYFLKHAEDMEEIPEKLNEFIMQRAFLIAEKANMTTEEGERYEVLEMGYRDRLSEIEWAKKEGMQKGIQEGMQKGMQKGMQEGMQKGAIKNSQRLIIRSLGKKFGKVPAVLVEQISSVENMEKLEELLDRAMVVENLVEFEV